MSDLLVSLENLPSAGPIPQWEAYEEFKNYWTYLIDGLPAALHVSASELRIALNHIGVTVQSSHLMPNASFFNFKTASLVASLKIPVTGPAK